MANHEKHIDDLLRDALGDHTEMPPSDAWAGMEEHAGQCRWCGTHR